MIQLCNLGGTIYYRDLPIVTFKYKHDRLQYVSEINKECKVLPFEFLGIDKVTDNLLRCFFDARIVPETRIGLNEELLKTPVKYYNPERIIRYQKGTCIHDDFWVKCDDDNECWD